MSKMSNEVVPRNLSSSTNVEVIKASYTWTITNFSFLSAQKERKLKSSVFSMGEYNQYKWRLRIYPNGCEDGSDTHISLFLQLVSPTEREVPASFDFAIIKSNGEKHILVSHKIRSYTQWKSLGYHELIDRSQLLDERTGLLSNDCLKLFCEVSVGTGNITNDPSPDEVDLTGTIKKNLIESFESLLYSQVYSDVTLVVGDERFQVHKSVLSVRSPVFGAMFEHDMQERNLNEVVIKDVEKDVLEEMIRFMYTGKAEKLDSLAGGLLAAADKYDLEDLKRVCEREIAKNLSVENAVNALVLADRHNSEMLREQALSFMRANAVRLVDTFTNIVLNPDSKIFIK